MKLWSFETANFKVVCSAEVEHLDPADSFEFQDDIDAVRNGDVDWFCACVKVYFQGAEIAADYLGGCAYKNASDFVESHRNPDPMARNCSIFKAAHPNTVICEYFPGMVRTAIDEAREHLRSMQEIYVRPAA